ncbi:MAG TPA: SGNH/GDSL hydrolase family protein [Thermoleophilaceae bacterium]|nr:SGNH/GDSL hydrolase family protein [Thermoleophilaceae bacterium]
MHDLKPAPAFDHPWTRFVAIGDSITEGYGMDPVEGVEPVPWAERVARALAAGKPEFEFHNLGWRNLCAAEIRDSQLDRALQLEPDLVSIAAGLNDLLASEVDRDRLERDMEPMYAAFAERGTFVFTYKYMDFPSSGLVPEEGAAFLRERMELLHDAIITLAERYGALVVDLYSDPNTANPGFFSEDLKHANAAGQAYVAEQTLNALAAALESGRAGGRAASG